MIVSSWRLHVNARASPRLDLLDFIRSVVSRLLKNGSAVTSGPSGRRVINNNVGPHHPVNAETQGSCLQCKKSTVKKRRACNVRLHLMCFYGYH